MPSELGRLRRVRMAASTSAAAGGLVLLSSGYLAWQTYGGRSASAAAKPAPRLKASEIKGGPEYIVLPADIAERFKKLDPIDAKEELKSLIPKHLRRPWKLLRAANWGEYEEHLNAVRELGKLNLNDGEYRQVRKRGAWTEKTQFCWFITAYFNPPGLVNQLYYSQKYANLKDFTQCLIPRFHSTDSPVMQPLHCRRPGPHSRGRPPLLPAAPALSGADCPHLDAEALRTDPVRPPEQLPLRPRLHSHADLHRPGMDSLLRLI